MKIRHHAYVSVLPPTDPDELVDHARRLVLAGVRRLSIYHLGLAGTERQSLFRGSCPR